MDAGDLKVRLSNLENKHRVALFEIEKRLMHLENSIQGSPTSLVEGRIQELEDLLLLQQIEITKLREMSSAGMAETLVPQGSPEYDERIAAIEERLSGDVPQAREPDDDIYSEIANIRKQMDQLSKTAQPGENLQRMGRKLGELEGIVNELEKNSNFAKVLELEEEIRSISGRIEEAPKPGNEVLARLESIEAAMENMYIKLENLGRRVDRELSEFGKKISSMEYSYQQDSGGVYSEVQKILKS
jgi:chromosome segregation ATPase